MACAAVAVGYAGSLYEHEFFLADLHGMRKHLGKGRGATAKVVSHIIVALLGRFKGDTGEMYHLTPLVSRKASGLEVWHALMQLIVAWDMRGVQSGPLFQNHRGSIMDMGAMDAILHEQLLGIQSKHPDLIPSDVNVVEQYSLNRSFWQRLTTQARNQGVSEPDIVMANRWRNTEKAGGRKLCRSMMEHYSEISQMIPTLVCYSQAL